VKGRAQQQHDRDRGERAETDHAQSAPVPGLALQKLVGNRAADLLMRTTLPPTLRAEMETLLGSDLADVRIRHDENAAGDAARQGAAAYARGTEITFAAGMYRPDTAHGRTLLAHELAHVVQQTRRRGPRAPYDALEAEADAAAAGAGPVVSSAAPGIQRKTATDKQRERALAALKAEARAEVTGTAQQSATQSTATGTEGAPGEAAGLGSTTAAHQEGTAPRASPSARKPYPVNGKIEWHSPDELPWSYDFSRERERLSRPEQFELDRLAATPLSQLAAEGAQPPATADEDVTADEDEGARLARAVAGREMTYAQLVSALEGSSDAEDIALEFMESRPLQSDLLLKQMLGDLDGRRALDRLYEYVTHGETSIVGGFFRGLVPVPLADDSPRRRTQAARIVALRMAAVPPEKFAAADRAKMMIFPFDPRVWSVGWSAGWDVYTNDDASIVYVRVDTNVPGAYPEEWATLPQNMATQFVPIPADQIVAVRRYDLNGVLEPKPAIYLRHLRAYREQKMAEGAQIASGLGFAVGSGGLSTVGKTGLSRALVQADRVAIAISALSYFANEERAWFEAEELGDVLAALDTLNSAAQIYGMARLVAEAPGLVRDVHTSYRNWQTRRSIGAGLGGARDPRFERLDQAMSALPNVGTEPMATKQGAKAFDPLGGNIFVKDVPAAAAPATGSRGGETPGSGGGMELRSAQSVDPSGRVSGGTTSSYVPGVDPMQPTPRARPEGQAGQGAGATSTGPVRPASRPPTQDVAASKFQAPAPDVKAKGAGTPGTQIDLPPVSREPRYFPEAEKRPAVTEPDTPPPVSLPPPTSHGPTGPIGDPLPDEEERVEFAAKTKQSAKQPAKAPMSKPGVLPTNPLQRYRRGNVVVEKHGEYWNIGENDTPASVPDSDVTGDLIQEATWDVGAEWTRAELTKAERLRIRLDYASKRPWLARIHEAQAKGRWVEARVKEIMKKQCPWLDWNRAGPDVYDPRTGRYYELHSGTISNLDRHARRAGMSDKTFRIISF
jgi:hypothetical protein